MNETFSVRQLSLAGLGSFLLSFTLGACFNGEQAQGLACESAAQCPLGEECIEGYCGGVFACGADESIPAAEVCDGFADCSNGEDELVTLCFLPEELYTCEDGETEIPIYFFCDGLEDCPDGEDEDGCGGIDQNQCTGIESGPDIAYAAEPAIGSPLAEPLPVEAEQFLGPPTPDFIVASAGGTIVEIISYGNEGLASPPMALSLGPFEDRVVVDFALGDVNGDNKRDIVIATQGETGFAAHVYENRAPNMPEPFGPPLLVQLPNALVPSIQAIKLGRLNNDSSTDMVAVVDNETLGNGRLMVSFGDSAAPDSDEPYFTPQLLDSVGALGYTMFFDMVMADFNHNGFDDVVVSGMTEDGHGLWLIARVDDDLATGWEGPFSLDGMAIPAAEIAVGAFAEGMGPDLVLLDPPTRRIQSIFNQNDSLMPGPMFEIAGSDPFGITLSDINCDGRDDFLFYQDTTVSILLGNGMGSVYDQDQLISAELAANGRGGIAVTQFDDDGTPDLVTTLTSSSGVSLVLSTGGEDLFSEEGEGE